MLAKRQTVSPANAAGECSISSTASATKCSVDGSNGQIVQNRTTELNLAACCFRTGPEYMFYQTFGSVDVNSFATGTEIIKTTVATVNIKVHKIYETDHNSI